MARRVDAFEAGEGEWVEAGSHEGDGILRLRPFEALELDLGIVWGE